MRGWTKQMAGAAVAIGVGAAGAQTFAQPAASGGAPVVLVVGCARPGAQPHIWELNKAAPPLQSPRPGITAEEKVQLEGRPLGQNRYQLIGVADFVDAETSRKIGVRGEILAPARANATGMLVAGHRVAVKGLYIEGVPARINLTSVVDLGAGCPEDASKEQA
jgi:hypothetical protein